MFQVIAHLRRLAELHGEGDAAARIAEVQINFVLASEASAHALVQLGRAPDKRALAEVAMDLHELAEMARYFAQEASAMAHAGDWPVLE